MKRIQLVSRYFNAEIYFEISEESAEFLQKYDDHDILQFLYDDCQDKRRDGRFLTRWQARRMSTNLPEGDCWFYVYFE